MLILIKIVLTMLAIGALGWFYWQMFFISKRWDREQDRLYREGRLDEAARRVFERFGP